MFTRRLIFGLLGAIALSACSHTPAPQDEMVATTTIYLVRHAEKQTGNDPKLTALGTARAVALGEWLGEESSEKLHIHSTNFKRTIETAAGAFEYSDLTVSDTIELYDPRDLPAMAAKLKALKGRHLVVGHSNTTPQLVALLGGEPGSEINEASEYDRLYIVQYFEDGTMTSELNRYGVRYVPEN